MATYQTVLDSFAMTYPECDSTTATTILNEVDEEILAVVPLRKTSVDLTLVASQLEYTLDETTIKVWSARLINTPTDQQQLIFTSVDELDLDPNIGPAWRNFAPATPNFWYTSENTTTGTLGLVPAPVGSSLSITGATNATPIVLTTGVAHGLSAGAQVLVSGVAGNTAANNANLVQTGWYVSVPSPTTLGLYSNSTLTTAVVGNGAYTSGGIVVAAGWPKVTLDITQRTALTGSTNMPALPQIRDLYVSAMKYRYALRRDPAKVPGWKAEYDANLSDTVAMAQKRTGRLSPKLQLVKQRPNFRGNGLGIGGTVWDGDDD